MTPWPPRTPNEVLDYTLDLINHPDGPWLQTGETISGTPVVSFVSGQDGGCTKSAQSNTSNSVTIWLSGGTPGEICAVSFKIVTTQGRTLERICTTKIVERI